ncbi:MAG: HAMP domain-containing histidine kinase [Candidatus Sungbacteria bacterium]|nr:HAMP domain-containing histidine kinase [Candidatus Sungbacteria bacterium]
MEQSQGIKPEPEIPVIAKPTSSKRFWALLRLIIFGGIIIISAATLLPIGELINSLSAPFLIGGFLITIMVLGGVAFLIMAPGNSAISSSLDIESIAVVVLGMLSLVALFIITLFAESSSPVTIFGLILMAIYTIYVYRLLHETNRGRQANETLRQKYGELLQFDKEKSDFITVTSHQLRTPLTEVRWALDSALMDKALPENSRFILQKCKQSVARLAGIVDDMFRARAFELTDSQLKKVPVDATSLIREILEGLELLSHQKETDVLFEPPETAVTFDADRAKIRIALENVIDNAIRYSPKGRVRITLRAEAKNAIARVEDSGIGIPPTEQNMIFTKFFRAKNALLLQPDGSGIGLYAAKTIVERHGGSVNFVSEPGKGTIFLITLPLVK